MADYPTRDKPPMPAGVIVALVGIGLYLALALFALVLDPRPSEMAQLGVACLFFVFLWRGHPLARQWAMFVSVMSILWALAILAVTPTVSEHFPLALVLAGVYAGTPIMVLAGLSPLSSRLYYDLQCPECQSPKVKAASFLYNKLKCQACKTTWLLREERLPADTFD